MKNRLLAYNIFEDNEYFDKYITLIEANKNTLQETFKTQAHHIIPRQFYKHSKLKLDSTSANIVNLTHKDHILAHYYLYLCCKEQYLKQSNATAVRLMVPELSLTLDEEIFLKSLPYYAALKEDALRSIAGENNPSKRDDVKQKISKAITGRKHSEETKEKLRKPKSEETKAKLIAARRATLAAHPEYAYILTQSVGEITEETRRKLSTARKGKCTGGGHWNYGKPAVNRGVPCPEHVKKAVSEANKGKKPRLGAKLSEETKLLISIKAKQRPKSTWVHNADGEYRVNLADKQRYLDMGFIPGRRLKNG